MMKKKMLLCGLPFILLSSVISGCGNGSNSGQGGTPTGGQASDTPVAVSTEPVTLTVLASETELDFNTMLIEPVKKKYPYITLNVIQKGKGATMKELAVTGQLPDLFTDWTGGMMDLQDLDVFFDIGPLLKSHKIDLNRFQPNVIDAMKANGNGTLYGLPFNVQLFMMLYNKDIFDKFGVSYPKDGMTWTQTVELAKKVTRKESGTQYRGLDPDGIQRVGLSYSQIIIDGKTNKSAVNNEQWKKVFELGKSMFSIPGNEQTSNPFNDFAKDKRLAMFATYNRFAQFEAPTNEGLNWDIAQYPSFEDRPNTYGLSNPWMMFITKQSKYKDQAMQVLSVLTSDEVQLVNARKEAKLSPLQSAQIKAEFGAELSFLKGKNVPGIFKSQPASAPTYSEFYSKATPLLVKSFNEYVDGKKDLNTALREADEQINKLIIDGK